VPRPDEFLGRTALVTGGAGAAIGGATCRALAGYGAAVVVLDEHPRRARATADALQEEYGVAAHPVVVDVTDRAGVDRGLQEAQAAVGPIDILVNNAGMQLRTPLTEISLENWRSVIDTDLTSAFLVGREVARRMIPRAHGKIINICSVQSELARPGIAAYTAAKGGLRNLTRAMAAEWSGAGLQVNGLAPGYILTKMTQPLADDPEFDAWVRNRTPARRWGRPEDLAGTAVWLASPASDFVTGQVIYVDGGMTSVV